MRKYTNPQAHGYLMEAEACEKVIRELRRIANKLQRAVNKEAANRQSEFEIVTHYKREEHIPDDYGWNLLTEKQCERYLDLFHKGTEALKNRNPVKLS